MKRHVISPIGPYSLEHAIGTPPGRPPGAAPPIDDGVLRAAFPLDGDWRTVGVRVTQGEDGDVTVGSVGAPSGRAVGEVVARALGLDVDATAVAAIARRDPVVRALLSERPGFRPRGFWSPYEAAVWAVLTQRTSMGHAASSMAWLASEYGERVVVDRSELTAMPAPEVLAGVTEVPGVPAAKVPRLQSVAVAASEGVLDGARLRSIGVDEARSELMEIEGIGPFSADLILVRGAQHPDRFSEAEGVLHDLVRRRYALDPGASAAEVAAVAEKWRPLRSWISVLVRMAGDP